MAGISLYNATGANMEIADTVFKELPDISYMPDNDGVRLLDMYLPETNKSCPLFLFFHGGGLDKGDRKNEKYGFIKYLAERGIAVASADYRLYPDAVFPDFIRDAASAAAFTLKYGKERGLFNEIYIGGSSAGAYLAMHLCFNKTYLSEAGVNCNDIKGFIFDAGQPTVHFNVLRERGMDPRRVCIDEAAALYYLDENFTNSDHQPKMMFIVADNDMPCRYEQNLMMIKNLEHFGYDMSKVIFHYMKGYSHCAYVSAKDSGGTLIYADMIEKFIRS